MTDAVLKVPNFWDGQASRLFTGQSPFGTSDTALHAGAWRNSQFVREAVAINNADLASQTVEPPCNTGEMSYDGRTWPLPGRNLQALVPLSTQQVAPDDSVLGALLSSAGNLLQSAYSYPALIKAAFQPEYWRRTGLAAGQYTQMESNFSLFCGLAIESYETRRKRAGHKAQS